MKTTNEKKIEKAKEFLESQGIYTGNLWCIQDIKINYDCTDEQAYEVLENALHNDGTIQFINEAIDDICDDLGIKSLHDEED